MLARKANAGGFHDERWDCKVAVAIVPTRPILSCCFLTSAGQANIRLAGITQEAEEDGLLNR